MAILQRVLNAVLALLCYYIAFPQIGAAQAGASGILTRVRALIGGIIFLNEAVTLAKTLGVGLFTFGVLMASSVFEKWIVLKRALALR